MAAHDLVRDGADRGGEPEKPDDSRADTYTRHEGSGSIVHEGSGDDLGSTEVMCQRVP